MEGRLHWQQDRDKLAAAMRHWQDADATHLSVNTTGAGLKTVDGHLAALARQPRQLRASGGSRSRDLVLHVKHGSGNVGSRPHVRMVSAETRV